MSGKDIFQQMFDNTKNIYKTIARDGVLGDIHDFFHSGCYRFNAMISGSVYKGYPGGKITALAGQKGVGKTFMVIEAIAEFLKKYPHGAVFFYESESAITKDDLINRGVDVDRVYFFPVATVEEWRNQQTQHLHAYNEDNYTKKQAHTKKMAEYEVHNKKAERHNNTKAVKDGKKDKMPIKTITEYKVERPLMMVLDSVGNLNAEAELNNALEGVNKQNMSMQRLIKSACRLITQKLSPFQVPMIMTSHVYVKMDGSGNFEMSGGSGPQFSASIIVFMVKSADYDKAEKVYLGNRVRCILDKGRLTREKSKCEVYISFKDGLNLYYGLIKPAVDMGVIDQGGPWFTFPNGKKVQGEGNIYRDPEKYIDDAVLASVDEWAKLNYCYGSDTDIPLDDAEITPPSKSNEEAQGDIKGI